MRGPSKKPDPVTNTHDGLLRMMDGEVSPAITTTPLSFLATHPPGLAERGSASKSGLATTVHNGFVTAVHSRAMPTITTTPSPTKSKGLQFAHRLPTGPNPTLPELPHAVKFLLAIGLLLGFVAAVLLYYANFPHPLGFLHRERRGPNGYTRVPSEYQERQHGSGSGSASAIELEQLHRSHIESSPHLCKRSGRHLTVDTHAAGLGIDLGHAVRDVVIGSRRSFDDKVLRPISESPPSAQQTFTAPLPSTRHFAEDEKKPYYRIRRDLETGLPLMPSEISEVDSRPTSPYITENAARQLAGEPYFGKISRLVEAAAEKGARFLYDQVGKEPQEGLLLGVRDKEREVAQMTSVHAK